MTDDFLKKHLPSQEMMDDFKKYLNLSTDEERRSFSLEKKYQWNNMTEEEKDRANSLTMKGLKLIAETADNLAERLDELDLYAKFLDVSKFVSMSYIAETYFGKTRAWLHQRLKGNLVNGKPAKFTPEERKKLAAALEDMSRKIHETALKIA